MLNREILQTGDLIFTYQNSLLNRLIKYFSSQDIDIKPDCLNIAHVGMYIKETDNVFEAEQDNVKLNKAKKYDNKKYVLHYGRIENVIIDGYHLFKLEKFMSENIGHKYSYLQLVFIMFKKIFNFKKVPDIEKGKYICSELICYTANYVWNKKLTDDFSGTSPLDLYISPHILKLKQTSIQNKLYMQEKN